MAYVIRDLGIIDRRYPLKKQTLSCMEKEERSLQKNIYNSECIQKRINEAAKVKERLDYEIKQRYKNIKHINFLG